MDCSRRSEYFTKLHSLSPLETVGHDLTLKYSPIRDLGTLKRVSNNLVLRHTNLESIGQLEYVGNNILISNNLKDLDFSRVNIGGKVKVYKVRRVKLPLTRC